MTDHLHPDLKGLKATTHALIEAVGGNGPAQIVCGHRSPSTLSAAASITFPDRAINAWDLMTLERHAGRPIVSLWMVQKLKQDTARPREPISDRDAVRLARECAEAKLSIFQAHDRRREDGTFSAADKAVVIRELRDLEDVARELRERLEDCA